MKKRGFTLAEVLIALCIIGIVSAIVFPLANKLKPDSTKVMYLKSYDTLVETINLVSANSRVYSGTSEYSRIPLFDTSNVAGNEYLGVEITAHLNKLCWVLAAAMGNGDNDNISCNDTYTSYNSGPMTRSFRMKNGADVYVTTDKTGNLNDNGTVQQGSRYQSEVYVAVHGSNADNCMYNETSCPKPEVFKFLVAADGHVYAADPMGRAYLRTRMNWYKSALEMDEQGIFVEIPNNENSVQEIVNQLTPEE